MSCHVTSHELFAQIQRFDAMLRQGAEPSALRSAAHTMLHIMKVKRLFRGSTLRELDDRPADYRDHSFQAVTLFMDILQNEARPRSRPTSC
jgi:hypothetical protein